MDDLIPALLDLIFWVFILDFSKKGEVAAKLLLWLFLIIIVAIGVSIVFTL